MADQYIAQVNNQLDQLDIQLRNNPYVSQAAQKTGVRPSLIVAGVGGFFVLFIIAGFGARFLTNLVGFVYPIYASFKALKTPDVKDDALWLTYWVVFGFFSLIESATDVLFFWIPFYNFVKMAFLIYLYAPQTQGANHIFNQFINPFLKKYERDIDEYAGRGAKGASAFVGEFQNNPQKTH